MDEYLSDQEQLDQVKAWLRENIPWIVIGVAAGALAVGGYRWWQARRDATDLAAAQRYQQVLNSFDGSNNTRGLEAVDQLVKDQPGSAYADQAELAAARVLLETGQLDRAAAYLTAVMEHSKDPELATAARERLARVQIAQGKPDAALATLGSTDQGSFQARFAEIRGDAYYAKNDRVDALREYRAARAAAGPAMAANDPLDLKINDLADEPAASAAASAGSQPLPKVN